MYDISEYSNFTKNVGIKFWSEFDVTDECRTEHVLVGIHFLWRCPNRVLYPHLIKDRCCDTEKISASRGELESKSDATSLADLRMTMLNTLLLSSRV